MTLARRLALVLIALVPASVALAQPKPALIQDRDVSARAPYQELAANAVDSSSSTTQSLLFPVVPAGKRLVITFVSLSLGPAVLAGDAGWTALSRLGGDKLLILPPPLLSSYDRVIAMPVTYYVEAGEQPAAILQSFGGWPDNGRVQALLVGYTISLP